MRKNAVRLGATDLVTMCDEHLQSRTPVQKKPTQDTHSEHSATDVVTGYHFVCARDRGVSPAEPGHFWSGSWVVAEGNVRNSLKYDAYLALHESKTAPSYRQGKIVRYRRSARDMLPAEAPGAASRREEGIEFLVRETNEPYAWVGGGAGEKGYRWTKIAAFLNAESAASEGVAQ
ncbi:MAG: hypothetical protein FJX62_05320 [Alphaproteobacteria bacterium]|nr:hypothetical protein [Alphaproteobacteria bacterium]